MISRQWKAQRDCAQAGSSPWWWLFAKMGLRTLGSLHCTTPLPFWSPFYVQLLYPAAPSGWVVSGRWKRQWKMHIHTRHCMARPEKKAFMTFIHLWLSFHFMYVWSVLGKVAFSVQKEKLVRETHIHSFCCSLRSSDWPMVLSPSPSPVVSPLLPALLLSGS